jgi:hypothetical protein
VREEGNPNRTLANKAVGSLSGTEWITHILFKNPLPPLSNSGVELRVAGLYRVAEHIAVGLDFRFPHVASLHRGIR